MSGFIRRNISDKIFDTYNYIGLTIVSVIVIYPFIYIILGSFSESSQLTAYSGILFKPLNFNINAYKFAFHYPLLGTGYLVSFFLVTFGAVYSTFLTSLGAFTLASKGLYWKKVLILFVLIPMFMRKGLIPFFLTVRMAGLYDNIFSLVIPFGIVIFNLLLLKSGFENIPDSLYESAYLDGARPLTVLFKLTLPLSKAYLAVIFLYYAVDKWNGWFYASVFLRKTELFPLALVLRQILLFGENVAGTSSADVEVLGDPLRFAIIIISSIPILVLYPFLQKYFTKGVLIGGVKE